MYSNAMQASPGAYQSPHYKSQRHQLQEWAMQVGYTEQVYKGTVEKVEGSIRQDDAFAHMVEEWIQYNIDYYVYVELFGDRYGPCTFAKPTCPEGKPIQQGIGRGGNTSRGGRGGSGCQSQSMNTNTSSPMAQASIGGSGRKGSLQTDPTSQGMGMGLQGHGGSGCAQGQNANQGYEAPTITLGQAVPSPSMGQPVKDYTGQKGPLRQGGRGGRGFGSHPSQGGSKNTKQQGLNQPPTNTLANMSSSEKDKAAKNTAGLGNKAPAGAPTGPRGAQRSGQPRQKGAQINQPLREGRVRQPMLGLRQGRPRFSVEAKPVGSRKKLFTLFTQDAQAVQQTVFRDVVRLTWWNSKGDDMEPGNQLFFLAESKLRKDMKEFDIFRELLRAHKALIGWVRRMGGSTTGWKEVTLMDFCVNPMQSGDLSYAKDEDVLEQMRAFEKEEKKAADAKFAKMEQDIQAAPERALQAIKEEEKTVEKVADSNTVCATLAPTNVDQGAEDSSEEEPFVIHKVHEETLVPDFTGKMVPVAELLRRAELRGAKNAMKEAKRKQAAEAVEQSHDVRDMLPKVEAFEDSVQRKRLKINPTNKDEEEGKGAAVSDAAASKSV